MQVRVVDGASVFVRIGDARRREELDDVSKVSHLILLVKLFGTCLFKVASCLYIDFYIWDRFSYG